MLFNISELDEPLPDILTIAKFLSMNLRIIAYFREAFMSNVVAFFNSIRFNSKFITFKTLSMRTFMYNSLVVCFCCLAINFTIQAQTAQAKAQVSQATYLGKTRPLHNRAPVPPPNNNVKKQERKKNYPKAPENFKDNVPMSNNNPNPLPDGMDPLRQLAGFTSNFQVVEPIVNIEGIDVNEAVQIGVPDTNGDVSHEHYVQVTNGGGSVFKIFDKEGNLLYGPASFNTLWNDLLHSGLGDPVVLYDQGADRWLFSELSSDFNTMLVAVSETNDPMGSFHAYQFQSPFGLPDYPKYGVWPDGYYITTNEGGESNIPVYILDREAMLNGESVVNMQLLGIPKFSASSAFAFQVATPADWDGHLNPPPPGSPQYVVRMYDDAWDGGEDKLEVWEISIDWDNPNNSSVNGPIELPTTPFDSDVCNGDIFFCLAQSNGSLVSALQQVLMHRVNYRNFGTHESIVLNFVVDVNGNNLGGIRWYELRKPSGGEWMIHQEGTHSPDNNHRFMGSIAIDAGGNIGLGYSVMGPDKHLSLRYTGRKENDPPGQMTVEEYEFATGLSYHEGYRWGDYAMMSVDESDGQTFWFTGEYMTANSEWGTKIVSFHIRKDTNDVGPAGLLTPQNSAFLTDSEQVQVAIKNFGLEPQSNFEIGYIFENNPAVVDTVFVTLDPDSVYYHTFIPTVDMSVIGDYQFKIFTSLEIDENIYNDTLRTVVSKLTRYDAAILNLTGFEHTVCGWLLDAGVILQNAGVEELTSVDIVLQLNADPSFVYNWTGSLLSGETDTLYFTLEPLLNGTNSFGVYTENPNGFSDEDNSNDLQNRDFEAVLIAASVKLELLTDLYASETTWELRDDEGTLLFSGGPYVAGQTLHEHFWCLPTGCYTFTIFDSYGDGIQFFGVEGDYHIIDGNGEILASLINPAFGFSESNEFCVPFGCNLDAEILTLNESQPGTGDGGINIIPANGTAPFLYSINGGVSFQNNPFFGNLPGGVYNVVVVDVTSCIYELEVEVKTCILDFSVTVTDATPGNQDGIIHINTTSGNAPYSYSIDGGDTFHVENIFSNLPPGEYTVVVRDDLGCLEELQVTVDIKSGTKQTVYGKSIEVYPNPTDGVFLIRVNGLADLRSLRVQIIDESGKLVQHGRLVNYSGVLSGQMSLYAYPAGVYFIRFVHDDFKNLVKIVRN